VLSVKGSMKVVSPAVHDTFRVKWEMKVKERDVREWCVTVIKFYGYDERGRDKPGACYTRLTMVPVSVRLSQSKR
jgi:hypothetical protein